MNDENNNKVVNISNETENITNEVISPNNNGGEKKKKNKSTLILIIIICLLIISFGLYICYDKGIIFNKDTDSSSNESSNKNTDKASDEKNISNDDNETTLTENEVSKIEAFDIIKYAAYEKERPNGLNSFSKDEIAALYLYYSNDSANNYKLIKEYDSNDSSMTGSIYEMNAQPVFDFVKKLFGNEANFNKKVMEKAKTDTSAFIDYDESRLSNKFDSMYLSCGYIYDYYDETKDVYSLNAYPGCGGFSAGDIYIVLDKLMEFESATKKNDELRINYKVLYEDCTFDEGGKGTCKIYPNPSRTNLIATKEGSPHISFNEYKDKAATLTILLKLDKSTNNYYFVSSTIK